MRAASPSVSVSFRRLSSATTGMTCMFLRRARPTRLAAACVLFTVALVMVPKADISETLFDEANIPTNEIVVVDKLLLLGNIDSRTQRLRQEYLRSLGGPVSAEFRRFT